MSVIRTTVHTALAAALVAGLASAAEAKTLRMSSQWTENTAGAKVDHTIVVFYYDIFPQAGQALADAGLTLHYLATWRDVLAVCREEGYFDKKTLTAVEAFLDEPLAWSGKHGGVSELATLNQ